MLHSYNKTKHKNNNKSENNEKPKEVQENFWR